MTDQTDGPETYDEPGEDHRQPAVQPLDPAPLRDDAMDALAGHATSFDPNRAVATSAPPASVLSGLPDIHLNEREKEAMAKREEEPSYNDTDDAFVGEDGDNAPPASDETSSTPPPPKKEPKNIK